VLELSCESAAPSASSIEPAGGSVSICGSSVFRFLRRLGRDFLAGVLIPLVDSGAGGLIGRWAEVLTDVEGCPSFLFA